MGLTAASKTPKLGSTWPNRTSIAHGAENDFGLEKTAQLTAIDLLLRKRRALVIAFKTQDPTNFGICTRVREYVGDRG